MNCESILAEHNTRTQLNILLTNIVIIIMMILAVLYIDNIIGERINIRINNLLCVHTNIVTIMETLMIPITIVICKIKKDPPYARIMFLLREIFNLFAFSCSRNSRKQKDEYYA